MRLLIAARSLKKLKNTEKIKNIPAAPPAVVLGAGCLEVISLLMGTFQASSTEGNCFGFIPGPVCIGGGGAGGRLLNWAFRYLILWCKWGELAPFALL